MIEVVCDSPYVRVCVCRVEEKGKMTDQAGCVGGQKREGEERGEEQPMRRHSRGG